MKRRIRAHRLALACAACLTAFGSSARAVTGVDVGLVTTLIGKFHTQESSVLKAQTAAVDHVHKREGLLMAPAYAMPTKLDRAGLTLQDFDYYEIHEAFAAQVLCTLKAWEDEQFCKEKLGRKAPLGSIDRAKLNVNGGSLAAAHPFAATGGRIVAGLAKMLSQKGSGRGLISICAAGGLGVTAIMEA